MDLAQDFYEMAKKSPPESGGLLILQACIQRVHWRRRHRFRVHASRHALWSSVIWSCWAKRFCTWSRFHQLVRHRALAILFKKASGWAEWSEAGSFSRRSSPRHPGSRSVLPRTWAPCIRCGPVMLMFWRRTGSAALRIWSRRCCAMWPCTTTICRSQPSRARRRCKPWRNGTKSTRICFTSGHTIVRDATLRHQSSLWLDGIVWHATILCVVFEFAKQCMCFRSNHRGLGGFDVLHTRPWSRHPSDVRHVPHRSLVSFKLFFDGVDYPRSQVVFLIDEQTDDVCVELCRYNKTT